MHWKKKAIHDGVIDYPLFCMPHEINDHKISFTVIKSLSFSALLSLHSSNCLTETNQVVYEIWEKNQTEKKL